MCSQTYPHSQVFVITYNEGTFYSVSETNPVRRSILGMRLPSILEVDSPAEEAMEAVVT